MNKNSSLRIQLLRAIAIIAVVGIHSNKGYYDGIWIRPFLNFAVGSFLFLSGYLTKGGVSDIPRFYQKRLLRVFIPYCIWSVLYTFVYNSWGAFVRNFLTGNCCDIYYFVLVYMQMVILTPFLIRLIKSRYWILGFIPTAAFVIVRTLMNLRGTDLPYVYRMNFFYSWLSFFYLGLCHARRRIDIRRIPLKAYIVLWDIFMALQILEGHFWFGSFGGHVSYDLAVSQQKATAILSTLVLCCIFVYYIEWEKEPADNVLIRLLKRIGDVSFGIYLTHVMLLIALNKWVYTLVPDIFPLNMILTTSACALILWGVRLPIGEKLSSYLGIS